MSRFDTFEGKKSDLKILILETITKPPKVIVNKFLCRKNSWLGAPLPTFEGSFLLFSWVFTQLLYAVENSQKIIDNLTIKSIT